MAGNSRRRWGVSLPCLSALAVGLALGQGRGLALFALAAAIHEGGHLLALLALGGRVEEVGFRLSGAEIRYAPARLSYGEELLVVLAGPAANLLAACLCALPARRWPALWYRFAGCQLALAVFNLLPALPLDGGRGLALLLEARWPLRGEQAALAVSGGIGLALAAAGAAALGKGGNLTLLAAGGVILLHFLRKRPLHRGKKRVK